MFDPRLPWQSWTEQAIHFLNPDYCRNRREEILISFAPDALNQQLATDESEAVGRVAPRAPRTHEKFPNNNYPFNAQDAAFNPQSPIPDPQLLFAGIDVARHHDQTVITILMKMNTTLSKTLRQTDPPRKNRAIAFPK